MLPRRCEPFLLCEDAQNCLCRACYPCVALRSCGCVYAQRLLPHRHACECRPRAKFARYDQDRDGFVDADELAVAFDKLEQLASANEKGSVPFSSFPDDVQWQLKELDTDGGSAFC